MKKRKSNALWTPNTFADSAAFYESELLYFIERGRDIAGTRMNNGWLERTSLGGN